MYKMHLIASVCLVGQIKMSFYCQHARGEDEGWPARQGPDYRCLAFQLTHSAALSPSQSRKGWGKGPAAPRCIVRIASIKMCLKEYAAHLARAEAAAALRL